MPTFSSPPPQMTKSLTHSLSLSVSLLPPECLMAVTYTYMYTCSWGHVAYYMYTCIYCPAVRVCKTVGIFFLSLI